MKKILVGVAAALVFVSQALPTLRAAESVKRILVVETTGGFRHSSIPTGEKVLSELAQRTGKFTLDFVRQPQGFPAHDRTGFPAGLRRGASDEEKKAFEESEAKWNEALKAALQKLSPENLKNYDAVLFLSTTGDLPIPDPQGFLDWIKNGGAFIGMHAASDTFHHWPGYIDMLGGEFDHHGAQLSVDCLNQDPEHPATAPLPKTWTIKQEEVYQFKNYDPAKVHDLLILDKKPQPPFTAGHYPVSWCKQYGKGRVFYTSLGHREDVWDTDPNISDRRNPEDVAKNYQAHILGGIEWALGISKLRSDAAIQQNALITKFGEESVLDGAFRIRVSERDGKLEVIRTRYFKEISATNPVTGQVSVAYNATLASTETPKGWKAQPGWFVFVENESRVWAYDGNEHLWLDTIIDQAGDSAAYGPKSFPCPIPSEVQSRLPESYRNSLTRDGV